MVLYTPSQRLIDGFAPYVSPYELTITSPGNLSPGSYPISLLIESRNRPAAVSEALALSFVEVNPDLLTYTAALQDQSTLVTVTIPDSDGLVGEYVYRILSTGWPPELNAINDGTLINVSVEDPEATETESPSVLIQEPADNSEFTMPADGSPLTVSFAFMATSDPDDPIVDLDVNVTGISADGISFTSAPGPNPGEVMVTGSVVIPQAGLYTLTARAFNSNPDPGTATVDFTVIAVETGEVPSITVNEPEDGAVFVFPVEAQPSVQFSFTAESTSGPVLDMQVFLNGDPVTITTLTGIGTDTASGSGNVPVTVGLHTFTFAATNDAGTEFSDVAFEVVQVLAPTVAISEPLPGEVITTLLPASVDFAFNVEAGYGDVESVTVTLNADPVSFSLSGSGESVSGEGVLPISSAGAYTLNVTGVNSAGVSASADVAFIVEDADPQPEPCGSIVWLPPVSLGKPHMEGSTVPIRFQVLDCTGEFVRDETVVIAISPQSPDAGLSDPEFFAYGPPAPNRDTYTIQGSVTYHLNYPLTSDADAYYIEVFTLTGADPFLLGTRTITVRGSPGKGRN